LGESVSQRVLSRRPREVSNEKGVGCLSLGGLSGRLIISVVIASTLLTNGLLDFLLFLRTGVVT